MRKDISVIRTTCFLTIILLILCASIFAYSNVYAPIPLRSQARSLASPYVSLDVSLGPRPSLATVRTEAPRFFLRPQPGHSWRITRLQRATLGAVAEAVGAPQVFFPPASQVYWVEAIGSAAHEVVALVALSKWVQHGLHRIGVVFDATTGQAILRYSFPY